MGRSSVNASSEPKVPISPSPKRSSRGSAERAGSLTLTLLFLIAPLISFTTLITLNPEPAAASSNLGSLAPLGPVVTASPDPDWDNLSGGDHGGEDWIITAADNNIEIADNHYNIGLFKIESGVTVTIKAYDGSSYGWVEIHADNIVIAGTLSADGKGYPGGVGAYSNYASGAGGAGPGGGGGGGGWASYGGGGGGGGYGGSGGKGSTGSGGGGSGGSVYTGICMGSGGGGGGGTGSQAGNGGRGGGKILLYGNNIVVYGNISANGGNGGVGSGTDHPGGGGGGSGGGISIYGSHVTVNNIISANGGNGGGAKRGGGGGGGGGRIRILYGLSLDNTGANVSYSSGSGGNNTDGGSGSSGTDGTYVTQICPDALYVGYPTADQQNPTNFAYSAPFFSAINHNGENVGNYQIHVTSISDTEFSNVIWDSGTQGMATTGNSARSPDLFYSDIRLKEGESYRWRIRFEGASGWGPWSTETATIGMKTGSLTIGYTKTVQFETGTLDNLTAAGDEVKLAIMDTHSINLERDSSQYLSISDASQTGLDFTGDLTVEAWVKVESTPGVSQDYMIISKLAAAGHKSYFWSYRDQSGTKKIALGLTDDGTTLSEVTWNKTLSTGIWHHLAVTYDASAGQAELYVDGSSEGTRTGLDTSIYNSDAAFIVGATENDITGCAFDGKIDDVRAWNDIRTSAEISTNYQKELTGNEENLQGYWKLNNNATDETSNSNDLTENNSPVYSIDVPFKYCPTGTFTSPELDSTDENTSSATATWNADTPGGTKLEVYLSNDGGSTWENVDNNDSHAFTSEGSSLRYKIEMTSTGENTPVLYDLTLSYTTIPIPTLLSPANGAKLNDNLPTFRWENVGTADNYEIQVANNSGFYSPTIEASTTDNSCTPASALSDDNYWWRVRCYLSGSAGQWSSTWTLLIDTLAPQAPSLTWPAEGENINDNTPNLQWGTVEENATPVLYYAAVSDNPDFPYENENSGWTTDDNFQLPKLAEGVWYWRVRAYDNAGNEGENSQGWFRIDLGMPTLLSPADGAQVNDSRPTFEWENVVAGDNFEVWVDNESSFSELVAILDNTTENSYQVQSEDALPDGTYYWRVRSYRGGEPSVFSPVRSVVVDTSMLVPNLISPPSGENLDNSTPLLKWTETPDLSPPVRYYAAVSDNSEFPHENRNSGWTTENQWEVSPALTEGEWYWHVRAKDNAGNEGENSDPSWFVIDVTPPSAPEMILPENDNLTAQAEQTLKWGFASDSLTGVECYKLYVDGAENQALENTENQATVTFADGVHTWYVKAVDYARNENSSETRTIRIDLLPPGKPTDLAVSGGEVELGLRDIYEWTEMNPSGDLLGAEYHDMAWLGGDKVVLFSGQQKTAGGERTTSDIWVYDLSDNHWENVTPSTSPPLRESHRMAYAGANNRVVLFGGYYWYPDYQYFHDTWRYNGSTWIEKTGKYPRRYNHAMAYAGGDKVLVFGGLDADSNILGDGLIYDVGSDEWHDVNPTPHPDARYQHAMAYAGNNKVVLFGGCGSIYYHDTWVFDSSQDKWTNMQPSEHPPAIYGHKMAYLSENKVVLFGGVDHEDETWVYDLSVNRWTQITSTPHPGGRYYSHAMARIGEGRALLFGGSDIDRDTWVFQIYTGHYESGSLTSRVIEAGQNITSATATWDNITPENTSIRVYLSDNGGSSWAEVQSGVAHAFAGDNNELRTRIVLSTDNALRTPTLKSFSLEYNSGTQVTDFGFTPENTVQNVSRWKAADNFAVSWTNPDDTSGVAKAYYKLDSAPTSNSDFTGSVGGTGISSISDLSVGSDGQHLICVWLEDNLGRVDFQNYATATLRLDTTDPAKPDQLKANGSSPSPWTNENNFTLTWTNPNDDSGIVGAYYKLGDPPTGDEDGTYVAEVGINSIPNVKVPGDGEHTVHIWLRDEAGNVNYVNRENVKLRLDTVSPGSPPGTGPTLVSPQNNHVDNTDQTFKWTTVTDDKSSVSYVIQVDNDSDWSSPTHEVTVDENQCTLIFNDDDNYWWHVKAMDEAGNETGWSGYRKLTLENLNSPPSSEVQSLAQYTNSDSFPIAASASDPEGDKIENLSLYYRYSTDNSSWGGWTLVGTDSDNSDGWSWSFANPDGDGYYEFYTLAADNRGNLGSPPGTFVGCAVDRVAPGKPSLISPSDDNLTADTTPQFEWSSVSDGFGVVDSGVTYTLEVGGLTKPGLTGTTYTLAGEEVLSQGTYSWRVRAIDGAGNENAATSFSLTVITKLDAPPLVSPGDGSATSETSVTLEWSSVQAADKYWLQCDTGAGTTPIFDDNVTDISQTLSSLSDDYYYWRVKAFGTLDGVDLEGNWSSSDYGWYNFYVDTTAPSITYVSINSGASSTTSTSVSLHVPTSDSYGSGVSEMRLSEDSGSMGSWVSYDEYPSFTLSDTLGEHTVYVQVRDAAGNTSGIKSDSITLEEAAEPGPGPGSEPSVDTTLPTLTVLAPTATEVEESLEVRVSASDDSGIDSGSIITKLDGSAVPHIFSGGVITIALAGLDPGDHSVWLSVSDTEGNTRERTISFTVTAPQPSGTTIDIGSVVGGVSADVDVNSAGTPFTGVVINPSASSDSASVTVQVLAGRPAWVPEPAADAVYSYVELEVTVGVENATIRFSVPRSWLTQNSVGENTIRLLRYSGGAWHELPTVKTGEDATHVFYSAQTPGFSTFAIAGEVVALPPTYALSLPTEAVTAGSISVTLTVANPTSTAISKEAELRIGGHSVLSTLIDVPAGQTKDFTLSPDVSQLLGPEATYDVGLYDSSTGDLLASGTLSFGAVTPAEGEEGSGGVPIIPLAVLVAGIGAAVGALWATGKLPFRRRPEAPPRKVETRTPLMQEYEEETGGRALRSGKPTKSFKRWRKRKLESLEAKERELAAESEVGEVYLEHIMPAAEELAEELKKENETAKRRKKK